MKPGDYTMTLYQGELAVATAAVTAPQSATPVTKDIASAEPATSSVWRIGEWDGTPNGFLNADKIVTMHPSDVRMSPWGPVTYIVGSSSVSSFPMAQWKDVNNPTTIKFDLSAAEIKAHTLRVGITVGFAGGRPQVTVNSWTSKAPSDQGQPKSRNLTVGTYRGNNVIYSFNIPASAFVAGANTMTLSVISGSGGKRFLSSGYAYDAVELDN
jgi:rhamnogalacturonan endolyase